MFLRIENEGTQFAGKIDITISDLLDFLCFKDDLRLWTSRKMNQKIVLPLILKRLKLKRRLDCVQQLFTQIIQTQKNRIDLYISKITNYFTRIRAQQYSHLRKSPTMERNDALEINREISKKIGKRSSGISSATSFSLVRRGDKLLLRLVLCKCSRKKVN